MDRLNNSRQLVLLGALVVGVTLASYWGVWTNGFVNYDDPDYVTSNEVVQQGLTADGLRWAVTTGHASNWHPLTWLSHMLDVTAFGLNPSGHHLTNLVLHLMNSVLVLGLLWQMTGAVWRSTFVATLFALHPLHVESVAWVAERKDVLSTFFGLLCLIAYARFVQAKRQKAKGKNAWYGAALVLLALGLMSKPMLVTWPFVMLLLDYWPLQRVTADGWQMSGKTWRLLAIEKIPFFALSFASSLTTLVAQRGAVANDQVLTMADRIGNALVSYVAYLGQTLFPTRLAVFYPLPGDLPTARIIAAAGILAGLSAVAIRVARAQPFAIVGWLWYLGTLVPVIGLVQVGAQAHADRYTYLPLIGIFLMLSWGLFAVVRNYPKLKWPASVAAVLALVALGRTTNQQVGYWLNSRTLFAHAAAVTTGNYLALGGIGIDDAQRGNWTGAMTNLTRALEFARQHHAEGAINYYLGVALQMQGQGLTALPYLESAVVSAELRPERDYRLGLSLIEANRLPEAEASLKSALGAKPDQVEFNLGLAALLFRQGEAAQAEHLYRGVLASHPDSSVAQKSFGDYLTLAGRNAEAGRHYAQAVRLKPSDVATRVAFASALQHESKLDEAITQYEAAAKLDPTQPQIALALAELLAQRGQPREAVAWYEHALQADPKFIDALNNLAWLLATDNDSQVRNGTRAVELAERACQLTEGKVAVLMGTLAAAYAEVGRFPDAIAMAAKARDRAQADGQEDIAKRNAELLKLYQSGKPFRDK